MSTGSSKVSPQLYVLTASDLVCSSLKLLPCIITPTHFFVDRTSRVHNSLHRWKTKGMVQHLTLELAQLSQSVVIYWSLDYRRETEDHSGYSIKELEVN